MRYQLPQSAVDKIRRRGITLSEKIAGVRISKVSIPNAHPGFYVITGDCPDISLWPIEQDVNRYELELIAQVHQFYHAALKRKN